MDGSGIKTTADIQPPGHYATAVVAYLAASFGSTFGLAALNRGALDLGVLGLTGAMVGLLGVIPFVVIKSVMGKYDWDGVLPHVLGGAMAAMVGFLLLGRWGVLNVKLLVYLLIWGVLAGLIYWTARRVLRKLFMEVAA